MTLYTLPKKFHPDFRQPNKQPRTLVECDPRFGKTKCYLPTPSGVLDISKGEIVPYENMSHKIDLGGVVTNPTGSNSVVEIPTEGMNKDSGAWLIRLKRDSSGTTNYLMDSTGTRHIFLFTSASTLQYFTNTGIRINTSTSGFPPFGEYFNMAITWPESELWINGSLIVTGTSGAPTGLGTNYTLSNRFTKNEPLLGSIALFAILDNKGKGSVKQLTTDPYQILKPVTPVVYFTADGAPPSGRIMGSLANKGGLAGLGGIAGPGGGLAG